MNEGEVRTGRQLRARIAEIDARMWEVSSLAGCHSNYLTMMLRGRKELTPAWRERIETAINTLSRRSGEPA